MINSAHEHAIRTLTIPHRAVLATLGQAGPMVSEFPCQAVDLELFLAVPRTSDHLFNLERDSRVAVHTDEWDLMGNARLLGPEEKSPPIDLARNNQPPLYVLVKVMPNRIHVFGSEGWGPAETIDLESFR